MGGSVPKNTMASGIVACRKNVASPFSARAARKTRRSRYPKGMAANTDAKAMDRQTMIPASTPPAASSRCSPHSVLSAPSLRCQR